MRANVLTLLLLAFGFGSFAQDSTAFFSDPGDGGIVQKRYIDVPVNNTDLQLAGDWTIEALIRMAPGFNSSQVHLVECYDQSTANGGFALRLSNQRVQAYAMGVGVQLNANGNQIIQEDMWTHIAATFHESSGLMTIYVNGVIDNQQTLSVDQFTSAQTMRIGARGDDADVNQYSLIDEVRVWDIARDSIEIISTINTCLTGTETGLQAYYTFENETGTTITDKTPNGHDGTIINPLVQGNYQNGAYSCNATAGDEELSALVVSVYPNPAVDYLSIESSSPMKTAQIVDLAGATVQMETTNSFSIEPLNPGIYFLHISTELGPKEIKFVKR
ncbi:MAG: hypothetical protein Crog4KO_28330 [Crocinitomicaceae bacterium]